MTTEPESIPDSLDELVGQEKYPEALSCIGICMERFGESAKLLVEKAQIILLAHDPEHGIVEAERCLVRAHELDRNNLSTICLLGRFYAVIKKDLTKQFHYENLFERIIEKKKQIKKIQSEFVRNIGKKTDN